VSALIILQSLGADVVGCNCSTGPQDMIKIIREMKPYAKVPLLAKPNAGLPKLIDGKTRFDMEPEEFGSYIKEFVEAGVNLLGGCCGTSPVYIEQIRKNIEGLKPIPPQPKEICAVASARKRFSLMPMNPFVVVERGLIQQGKRNCRRNWRQGMTSLVRQFAVEQVEKGADILTLMWACQE